jgi:hypothetical protein
MFVGIDSAQMPVSSMPHLMQAGKGRRAYFGWHRTHSGLGLWAYRVARQLSRDSLFEPELNRFINYPLDKLPSM